MKCVRRIQKTVPPYGSLKLPKCSVDVLIKPASPQDFPNMDAAIGSIYLRSDSLENSHKLLSAFDIILERDTLSIPPEPLPGHLCVLEIPIKYDVESSSTADHSVEIQSLESCLLKVTTDSGAITTKSVKGDLVELITNSGTVDCGKSIQGNINICTNSGDIQGKRFQGTGLKMETVTGNITTESVYSDVSSIKSVSGNVNLKNLHRDCSVIISGDGNLTISGMDGNLQAQLGKGRHEIQISRLKDLSTVKLNDGGCLKLKIPEPCPFSLRIRVPHIKIPESLERCSTMDGETWRYGDYAESIEIVCEDDRSEVIVEHQDWFASLGLSFK